jgi:hypothetical protein
MVFCSGTADACELYVRGGEIIPSRKDGLLKVAQGCRVSFDTYFGIFAFRLWQRVCKLKTVNLNVAFKGRLHLRLKALTERVEEDQIIGQWVIDHSTVTEQWSITIGDGLAGLNCDAVYVDLEGLAECLISGISFSTSDEPLRTVGLGLVITTYKRLAAVNATLARLREFATNDPERILGSLQVVVVDNGNELEPSSCDGITILRNPNMGGAGGFARGLSYLIDNSSATHACFMDDDASTAEECILRTRRFIAFAQSDRVAVSAAMLRSERPYLMHEQGALFEWGRNHRIISRKKGLDLRIRRSLCEVVRYELIRYGGFWFFAFPIQKNLKFPYPLFVRGDDWLFSYMNNFEIETMPGVASWQEGFEGKTGPIEQYLAMKAFMIAELILREPRHPVKSAAFFFRWLRRNLEGFLYDRGSMNCEAIRDVLRGPQFWANNVVLDNRLRELEKKTASEIYTEIPEETNLEQHATAWTRRSVTMNLLRLATLDGVLAPKATFDRWFKSRTVVRRFDMPVRSAARFCTEIEYRDVRSNRMFVARKNAVRHVRLWSVGMALCVAYGVRYRSLRRAYMREGDRLCTKEWWDRAVAVEMQRMSHECKRVQ